MVPEMSLRVAARELHKGYGGKFGSDLLQSILSRFQFAVDPGMGRVGQLMEKDAFLWSG